MNALMDIRLFTCWVMFERAVDDDGWVAHNLEFDIVSQGDSPEHALEMVTEATGICLLDDLNDGVDPEQVRKRAPDEYWKQLYELMQSGSRVPFADIKQGSRKTKCFAMQIMLPFIREQRTAAPLELQKAPPPSSDVFAPQQFAC